MKFIYSLKADSNFTLKLETAAHYAKANSVFKDEYMFLEDVIEEEKEIAREEGRTEGLEETAKALLKEGIPIETIVRCIGLPLERVKELEASLKK